VRQECINKLFTTFVCFGPVPRTCLKFIDVTTDEAYNESLENYLREVDREIEGFIAHGGRETIAHTVHHRASHRIAIMHPTATGFSYTARVITRWVAYRLYEKASERSQQDCLILFKLLSRQATLRTAAGWFFEGYVHDWFQQGGTFEADEFPIVHNHTRQFVFRTVKAKSSSPNFFTTATDLANLVKAISGTGINRSILKTYFLPYSCNYPSVDGLLFSDMQTLVLLQMTMAQHHEIKSPGVAQLLLALPRMIRNVYFVFVVPEDRAEDYSRAQPVPDQASLHILERRLCLKQYRLVLSQKCMQDVAMKRVVPSEE